VLFVGSCEWIIRNYILISVQGVFESLVSLSVSMIIWSIILGFFVWCFPRFFGIHKSTIQDILNKVMSLLKMVF
jgi:hypothetical protein